MHTLETIFEEWPSSNKKKKKIHTGMFKMLNQHMTSGRRNKMVEYSASKL